MTLQPRSPLSAMRMRGFSLREMLVALALLGMLASLVLSGLPNINQQSNQTRDKRNAQELATVCATAQAAGVDFVVAGDMDQTIKNVVAGGEPADGAFAGRFFGLPGLTPVDQGTAKTYLLLDNGSLQFLSNP